MLTVSFRFSITSFNRVCYSVLGLLLFYEPDLGLGWEFYVQLLQYEYLVEFLFPWPIPYFWMGFYFLGQGFSTSGLVRILLFE